MLRTLFFFALLAATTVMQAGVPANPSKAELHEWMREALAAAEKIPLEQRRARMRELEFGDTRLDDIKEDLYRIALRPQFYNAYNLVLDAQRPRNDGMFGDVEEAVADRAAAEEFVVELYRSRMGTASEEARNWQHGLAEFLLTMGRWKEALPLARAVYEHDRDAYTTTMLAVIEKLNGDDAMFAAVVTDCPELDNNHGAHFCADVAMSLANRMTHVLAASRIPQGIRDILSGKAKPETTWEHRLQGLAILKERDPKAADTELRAILAADAPAWAKDDAIILLMQTSSRLGNKILALNLSDCWLARRGVKAPVVDAATWEQILAMEKPPKQHAWLKMDINACRQQSDETAGPLDPAGECMSALLQYQVLGVTNPGDPMATRQALEWLASIVASTGRGLGTLATMLAVGAAEAGVTPERRDNVLRFAAQLPVDSEVVADRTVAAVRTQTQPVTQPWSSPTVRRPPLGCP